MFKSFFAKKSKFEETEFYNSLSEDEKKFIKSNYSEKTNQTELYSMAKQAFINQECRKTELISLLGIYSFNADARFYFLWARASMLGQTGEWGFQKTSSAHYIKRQCEYFEKAIDLSRYRRPEKYKGEGVDLCAFDGTRVSSESPYFLLACKYAAIGYEYLEDYAGILRIIDSMILCHPNASDKEEFDRLKQLAKKNSRHKKKALG